MSPLTKALLSKCEFDEKRLKQDARVRYESFDGTLMPQAVGWYETTLQLETARYELARLMPLIRAMVDVVEALELIAEIQEIDPPALERLKGLVSNG